MSDDSYDLVRLHPLGGYALVNGSASDDRTPVAEERHDQYGTIEDALKASYEGYTEYGVSVHPECSTGATEEQEKVWRLTDRVTMLENLVRAIHTDVVDQLGWGFYFDINNFSDAEAALLKDLIGKSAFEAIRWE